MTESYEELDKLPETATSLEKTNVLMKLRETLTDESEDGTEVTVPNGISIYPNNVCLFLVGCNFNPCKLCILVPLVVCHG